MSCYQFVVKRPIEVSNCPEEQTPRIGTHNLTMICKFNNRNGIHFGTNVIIEQNNTNTY